MWLPFISKINKLEKEKSRLWNNLHDVICSVQNIMKTHGKFVINRIGSGDNTYIIDKKRFEFNEFIHKHCGFFINGQKVPLHTFITFNEPQPINNKKLEQTVTLNLDDVIELAKRINKEINVDQDLGQIQYFLFKSIRDYKDIDFMFLKD